MKLLNTIALIFFLYNFGVTQSVKLEKISFDENLSFGFPQNHERLDTLGQKTFIYNIDPEFTLVASLFKANYSNHTNINELKKGYDNYVEGVMDGLINPKLVSTEDIIINSLVTRRAEIEFSLEGTNVIMDVLVIFIKSNTYSFQLLNFNPFSENENLFTLDKIAKTFDSKKITQLDQIEDNSSKIERNQGRFIAIIIIGLMFIGGFMFKKLRNNNQIDVAG